MNEPRGRAAAVLGNRRLLLLLIAGAVMALVVVSVIGYSGAYFTSQSTSPGNEFDAGSVDLRIAEEGELLAADGLLPGDQTSGEQTVTNVEHRAAVTLTLGGDVDGSPLAEVLQVTVRQTAPAITDPVWTGTLNNLDDVPLGRFEAAEQRTFLLEVSWPAAANDPALQGARTSFDFRWQAESFS